MKKIIGLFLVCLLFSVGISEARYKAVYDSARDKTIYTVYKKLDHGMKYEFAVWRKEFLHNGDIEYSLVLGLHGKRFGTKVIGEQAWLVVDGVEYEIQKNYDAPHVSDTAILVTKTGIMGRKVCCAEFYITNDIVDVIKNAKNFEQMIGYKIKLDGEDKELKFTKDFDAELKAVLALNKEDYEIVKQKKVKIDYPNIKN